MRLPARERGVVLIAAMLLVALAATAASAMLEQQDVAVSRLQLARDYEQARWVLKGGTHWARAILAQDARSTTVDHGGELWATGLPPTDIEQANVSGEILDQQALFNLNNLARDGKASEPDVAALRRLLRTIGIAADLADAVADWIDADSESRLPGGGEDPDYLALGSPYRAANQPLSEIAELRRVRGFDESVIARLRQFATVLPRRTAVNINTAAPEVLVAVVDGLTLAEAAVLAAGRSAAPIADLADFRARLPRRELQASDDAVAVRTQFFLVQGHAIVGRAQVRTQALLQRDGTRLPHIVWQRTS
jgi:general secretion pathway protein K